MPHRKAPSRNGPTVAPTQNERVLAHLRQGPLAAVDFQPPGVVDGGPPIWRIAARINNLKARGCVIRSERQPDGTAVYHLVSEPDVERVDSPAPRAASLPLPDAAPAVGSLSAELFDADEYVYRPPWEDAAA